MFASLATVAKLVLVELPPFGLIALRVPSAALLLWVARAALGWQRVRTRDLSQLAAYALFGIVLNQLLFASGLARTTATNAVVLGATIPVFTTGMAVALKREGATWTKLVGLGVACAGALTLVGADRFETGGEHFAGDLMIILNCLSFSVYLVISRRLLERYEPLTVIAWTMTFGAIGVIPFGMGELYRHAPGLSTGAWWALAYIAVFPTVGSYFLNGYALKRAPSSVVAVYIYLQVLVGALIAAWALGERPGAGTALGGVLIGAGIWLVTRTARRDG